MEQRIDLHQHTTLSDGNLSPQELVSLKSYLDVLCITDHYLDCTKSYKQGSRFAQKHNHKRKKDEPLVIIGIEYPLKVIRRINTNESFLVEVLIFGDKAIRKVMGKKPKHEDELRAILEETAGVAILCHPYQDFVLAQKKILKTVCGFETTSRGVPLEMLSADFLKEQKSSHLKLLCNSDFHYLERSGKTNGQNPWAHNIFHHCQINSENDLIAALLDKEQQISPCYHNPNL